MDSWMSSSASEKITYIVFLFAAGVGIWIGGSFLISLHLDETSLPRRV
jgi:hypothetical protein